MTMIRRCLLLVMAYSICSEGRSLVNQSQHPLGKTSRKKTAHHLSMDKHSVHLDKMLPEENKSSRKTKDNTYSVRNNNNKIKRRPISLKSGRKSTIDIHENLTRSPVIYNSPDGKDYYVYVKVKSPQQPAQATLPGSQTSTTVTQGVPSLPSKTFLVTVYGEQLAGAEDKIRQALSQPLQTTPRPCSCPCCPCACKSPKLLKEIDCSCEKPERCPCESEQDDNNTPNATPAVMIFPMTGQFPQGHSACSCPCCTCSCTEPWHETYDCGCQKSPPVPCPCGASTHSAIQAQSTGLYQDPNCHCQPSSPTPCSCSGTDNVIPSQGNAVTWTDVLSPSPSCSCPCCPCACAQQSSYPGSNYCACASQPGAPCPCSNHAALPAPTQQGTNVIRSSGNHVNAAPGTSPNAVQTYNVGPYDVQTACDCFCCPCSCPVTFSSDNSQCSCGPEAQQACTCKRGRVLNKDTSKSRALS